MYRTLGNERMNSSVRREEKTEQLIDTRNELDRLDVEMQKLKQEVWKGFQWMGRKMDSRTAS